MLQYYSWVVTYDSYFLMFRAALIPYTPATLGPETVLLETNEKFVSANVTNLISLLDIFQRTQLLPWGYFKGVELISKLLRLARLYGDPKVVGTGDWQYPN